MTIKISNRKRGFGQIKLFALHRVVRFLVKGICTSTGETAATTRFGCLRSAGFQASTEVPG
jgi:hypothetical protein